MKRRLPPLNSLRSFEAAARLSSMSLAAAELNVTQAAVSKQVKTLELSLGKTLFWRLPREIRLTEEGEQYFQAINRILDELDSTTRNLGAGPKRHVVRFLGYYGFNMHWLIPHLPEFLAEHSDIEVKVVTSLGEHVDFSRNAVDCAVRNGRGDWTDCDFTPIVPLTFRPVCRPDMQERHPLRYPADLVERTLLHQLSDPDLWPKWLAHLAETGVDLESGLQFENAALCTQAALQGLGVAMADCLLVSDYIKAGLLCYPFEQVYRDPRSYYFLCPRGRVRPGVHVFRNWLMERLREDSLPLAAAG